MSKLREATQTVVRLLLGCAAVAGAVALWRLLLMPVFQSAFHLGAATTTLLRRSGIFLSALSAYWVYARRVEKRRVPEVRLAPAGIAMGALSGALLISVTTLSLFAAGSYEVTSVRGLQRELLGAACVIFIAAMLEEIVFRGLVFQILESALGTTPAVWLQSLVFAALHLGNITGSGPLTMATMLLSATLISAFWTLIFVRVRNLWVVGAHHAAWNFAILLTGLPLSGVEDWRGIAPFKSRYHGPDWLTGGIFGPEDSFLTIGLIALCLVALLFRVKQTGRLLAARPRPASPSTV